MSRLEQLEQFVHDDPDNPFNVYALALEYLKSDVHMASKLFEQLLREHENYLPTYYQAANLLEQLGKRDQAIAILLKGIALAKNQKQDKAQRELQSVYDELQEE